MTRKFQSAGSEAVRHVGQPPLPLHYHSPIGLHKVMGRMSDSRLLAGPVIKGGMVGRGWIWAAAAGALGLSLFLTPSAVAQTHNIILCNKGSIEVSAATLERSSSWWSGRARTTLDGWFGIEPAKCRTFNQNGHHDWGTTFAFVYRTANGALVNPVYGLKKLGRASGDDAKMCVKTDDAFHRDGLFADQFRTSTVDCPSGYVSIDASFVVESDGYETETTITLEPSQFDPGTVLVAGRGAELQWDPRARDDVEPTEDQMFSATGLFMTGRMAFSKKFCRWEEPYSYICRYGTFLEGSDEQRYINKRDGSWENGGGPSSAPPSQLRREEEARAAAAQSVAPPSPSPTITPLTQWPKTQWPASPRTPGSSSWPSASGWPLTPSTPVIPLEIGPAPNQVASAVKEAAKLPQNAVVNGLGCTKSASGAYSCRWRVLTSCFVGDFYKSGGKLSTWVLAAGYRSVSCG